MSAADVAVVAHHRTAMFLAMGKATPDIGARLTAATERFLEDAIPRGEYVGWLACDPADPTRVLAGAGVQVRRVLPLPLPRPGRSPELGEGRQAIVINVYTEPAHRRRGLARSLMQTVMAWAKETGIESLVLHAAPDGRPLYEELGFVQTNEMRWLPGA